MYNTIITMYALNFLKLSPKRMYAHTAKREYFESLDNSESIKNWTIYKPVIDTVRVAFGVN